MDRKYLEEHLSAYLDNELEPKQMREFEQALAHHPDLMHEVERLQRLNQLARETEIPMPAEGYFDNLAERIESRIAREFPKERGKIVDFLLARRKAVAIISSVAAVFLIAVIGVEFYGPGREMYPGQIQRTIELKQEETETAPPSQGPEAEKKDEAPRMMVKPPRGYGDTAGADVKEKPIPKADAPAKDADIGEQTKLKSSPQRVLQSVPNAIDATETANVSSSKPADTAEAAEAVQKLQQEPFKQITGSEVVADSTTVVIATRNLLSPQAIIETSKQPSSVQPKKLEKSAAANQPQVMSGEGAADPSAPAMPEVRHMARENSKFVWPVGAADHFESILRPAIDNENWGVVEIWPAAGPGAGAAARDSLLEVRMAAHYQSKDTVSTERWHAERAFLVALDDEFSEQSCVYARVLISHYLESVQVSDRNVWEARLDSVRTAEAKYRSNE